MEGTVLVADDDKAVRTVLASAIGRTGCKVKATGCLKQLQGWVEAGMGDLVITDVMMPDGNGLEMIRTLHAINPDLPVIVISAQNTIATAIGAKDAEAFEYLPKPFDLHTLLAHCKAALARRPKSPPPPAIGGPVPPDWPLTGRGPVMQALFRQAAQVINTDLPLVITGEAGSGRSRFATAMHALSEHSSGGALTIISPADHSPIDKATQISSGTILIEDPALLPHAAQAQLGALIGHWQDSKTGPRLIAITGPEPLEDVESGKLRSEFYYRMAGMVLTLPPLRERPEDIIEIAGMMLEYAGHRGGLSEKAEAVLLAYPFPGNLRELEQLTRRLVLTADNGDLQTPVTAAAVSAQLPRKAAETAMPASLAELASGAIRRYLDMHAPELPPAGLYQRILQEVERPLLALALDATGGNQLRCAELLGINRNTLRKKLTDLDITPTVKSGR